MRFSSSLLLRCGYGVMVALTIAIINGCASPSYRQPSHCEHIAVATSCLYGAGCLSRPLRVEHVTNGQENVITFFEIGNRHRDAGENQKLLPLARVRISEDLIRLELIKIAAEALSSEDQVLERAVVIATTWAAAKGGLPDIYEVRASQNDGGFVTVFFETDPTRYGGHFVVNVRDNVVLFGAGR